MCNGFFICFAVMNTDLRNFLEQQYRLYNKPEFIVLDPISIPHRFTKKEDIEIAGFLAATLSWGQRKTILSKSLQLMELMENQPYAFLTQSDEKEFLRFADFKHRTFNGDDCIGIFHALKAIYLNHGGLEKIFSEGFNKGGAFSAIENLSQTLFSYPHLRRTEKHIAKPSKGSAAKRVNMFLRWMVRNDNHGVDFGIWKDISPSQLICPLDLHSGRIARQLGILKRTTDDWRAAVELTENLKLYDPNDPVKYDFALFGTGVNGISLKT
jgi:uncharacterized protein (TIGR02757 family)